MQRDTLTDTNLKDASGFEDGRQTLHRADAVSSIVKYDLIGKIAENAQLTRKTTAEILTGMQPAVFGQFRQNPEHFIAEASRIISEQKATMIIERLTYDEIVGEHDAKIFTVNQTVQDFSRASDELKKHIHDYAILDSDVGRRFVANLETSGDVVVYAKLPRGFLIPTPVGDYNPDWAISFREGSVKYIYFVAETKGSLSSLTLREIEKTKIVCAKKFFDEIGKRIAVDRVKYDVVDSYEKLMDIVGRAAA
jgi:type III restriction enzyme